MNEIAYYIQFVPPGLVQRTSGLDDSGFIYTHNRKKGKAHDILNQLRESWIHGQALAVQIAIVFIGMVDKDKAVDWLYKDYEERNDEFGYLMIRPE